MWNKSADAKPSPQGSDAPGQAPTTAKVTLPDAVPTAVTPAVSTTPSGPRASLPVTTIAAGIKISGEFLGNSDLYIDGEVLGRIRLLNSRVTVGAHGSVQADVEAREIEIDGVVQGNLKASERIRLGSASRVQGSVATPRIAIEDGARLRGKVEMLRTGDSREASTVSTANANTNSVAARAMSAGSKDK